MKTNLALHKYLTKDEKPFTLTEEQISKIIVHLESYNGTEQCLSAVHDNVHAFIHGEMEIPKNISVIHISNEVTKGVGRNYGKIFLKYQINIPVLNMEVKNKHGINVVITLDGNGTTQPQQPVKVKITRQPVRFAASEKLECYESSRFVDCCSENQRMLLNEYLNYRNENNYGMLSVEAAQAIIERVFALKPNKDCKTTGMYAWGRSLAEFLNLHYGQSILDHDSLYGCLNN